MSKSIIFEVLKLIAPASARHTAPFATEPMLVAICGIMKRCWEISQNPKYKDELRPRLQDGGELPKRSAYIEIMFEIWKNTVRILANILGTIQLPRIMSLITNQAITRANAKKRCRMKCALSGRFQLF